MRRVMVLGGAGAGKSTFARALGGRLSVPVVHLDSLYWESGWVPAEEAVFLARIEEAVRGDAWVMDGNYSRTWPMRLARADTVILLDVSTPRRLARVVRRSLANYGRTRADLGNDCPEQLPDGAFLRWILGYNRRGRGKALALLADASPEIACHHLRGAGAARRFLDQFSAPCAAAAGG
ncbi:MAG: DNA topology modulation protein FlaR [Pseudomonadota bacterium]